MDMYWTNYLHPTMATAVNIAMLFAGFGGGMSQSPIYALAATAYPATYRATALGVCVGISRVGGIIRVGWRYSARSERSRWHRILWGSCVHAAGGPCRPRGDERAYCISFSDHSPRERLIDRSF